jgi:hypothetical protein
MCKIMFFILCQYCSKQVTCNKNKYLISTTNVDDCVIALHLNASRAYNLNPYEYMAPFHEFNTRFDFAAQSYVVYAQISKRSSK